jgi:hypothetical protein
MIIQTAAAALTYGVAISLNIMRRRWLPLFYCEHGQKFPRPAGQPHGGLTHRARGEAVAITSGRTWH